MAVIPTGSASLRGVGPRAPAIRDFRIDVQNLGRAAITPALVSETIGRAGAARRERKIDAQTFDDRMTTATTNAAGTARRAGDINAREDIIAAEELAREADVQQALADKAWQEVNNFEQTNAASQLGLDQEIAEKEMAIENLMQDLEVAKQTKAQSISNRVGAKRLAGVEQGNALAAAQGTPISQIEDRPDGRYQMKYTRTPTGELQLVGETQVMNAQQLAAEQAQLDATLERARAYAKQVQVQADKLAQGGGGGKITTAIKELKGAEGLVTEGYLVIATDENGQVVKTTEVNKDGTFKDAVAGQGTTPDPIAAQLGTTAATATPAGSQSALDAPQQRVEFKSPQTVETQGVLFEQTGPPDPSDERYTIGNLYNHPEYGPMVYTGGPLMDPKSWKSLSFQDQIEDFSMTLAQ